MKINKRNPLHWAYLAIFALNVVLGLILRCVLPARGRPLVLLYGHKLNGNLKALYAAAIAQPTLPCDIEFLSMDPGYVRELRAAGIRCHLALAPAGVLAIARVRCIISDHGLHVMQPLPGRVGIRFADVWHGIPFKGWEPRDFAVQHRYDEVWVSSARLRELWISKLGFAPERVHATGYARVDQLVGANAGGERERRPLIGGGSVRKVVLFAPTWQHGSRDHRIFPFGVSAEEFFLRLGAVCTRHDACCLLRTHLNTRLDDVAIEPPFRLAGVDQFPDTEAVLAATDVLVCDWSSIAFDFLVLQRPAIFLDVPPPFPKGLTLGPEYRYGDVVPDLDALCDGLDRYLAEPADYQARFGARAEEIQQAVYGPFADGQAAARCLQRLEALL